MLDTRSKRTSSITWMSILDYPISDIVGSFLCQHASAFSRVLPATPVVSERLFVFKPGVRQPAERGSRRLCKGRTDALMRLTAQWSTRSWKNGSAVAMFLVTDSRWISVSVANEMMKNPTRNVGLIASVRPRIDNAISRPAFASAVCAQGNTGTNLHLGF